MRFEIGDLRFKDVPTVIFDMMATVFQKKQSDKFLLVRNLRSCRCRREAAKMWWAGFWVVGCCCRAERVMLGRIGLRWLEP